MSEENVTQKQLVTEEQFICKMLEQGMKYRYFYKSMVRGLIEYVSSYYGIETKESEERISFRFIEEYQNLLKQY